MRNIDRYMHGNAGSPGLKSDNGPAPASTSDQDGPGDSPPGGGGGGGGGSDKKGPGGGKPAAQPETAPVYRREVEPGLTVATCEAIEAQKVAEKAAREKA